MLSESVLCSTVVAECIALEVVAAFEATLDVFVREALAEIVRSVSRPVPRLLQPHCHK